MDISLYYPRVLIFDPQAAHEAKAAEGQLRKLCNMVTVCGNPQQASDTAETMNSQIDLAILILSDSHIIRDRTFGGVIIEGSREEAEMVRTIRHLGLTVYAVEHNNLLERFSWGFGVFHRVTHEPAQPSGVFSPDCVPTRPKDEYGQFYFSRHWRNIFGAVKAQL